MSKRNKGTASIIDNIDHIEYIICDSKFEMDISEKFFINEYKPSSNTLDKYENESLYLSSYKKWIKYDDNKISFLDIIDIKKDILVSYGYDINDDKIHYKNIELFKVYYSWDEFYDLSIQYEKINTSINLYFKEHLKNIRYNQDIEKKDNCESYENVYLQLCKYIISKNIKFPKILVRKIYEDQEIYKEITTDNTTIKTLIKKQTKASINLYLYSENLTKKETDKLFEKDKSLSKVYFEKLIFDSLYISTPLGVQRYFKICDIGDIIRIEEGNGEGIINLVFEKHNKDTIHFQIDKNKNDYYLESIVYFHEDGWIKEYINTYEYLDYKDTNSFKIDDILLDSLDRNLKKNKNNIDLRIKNSYVYPEAIITSSQKIKEVLNNIYLLFKKNCNLGKIMILSLDENDFNIKNGIYEMFFDEKENYYSFKNDMNHFLASDTFNEDILELIKHRKFSYKNITKIEVSNNEKEEDFIKISFKKGFFYIFFKELI